jgi:hypothetical protein
VTGNFGDNSDYPKAAMNKFTTDRSDEHRPLSICDRKWEEGGAATRRAQARFAR